jgi:hypothetical protein
MVVYEFRKTVPRCLTFNTSFHREVHSTRAAKSVFRSNADAETERTQPANRVKLPEPAASA